MWAAPSTRLACITLRSRTAERKATAFSSASNFRLLRPIAERVAFVSPFISAKNRSPNRLSI
jgi:hypothetical protein